MTTDTSKWPEAARYLAADIAAMCNEGVPYEGRGYSEMMADLEALVSDQAHEGGARGMTQHDTSKWPEEARRVLQYLKRTSADGVVVDLEALVSRLCPDPEAHGPADVCGKPLMEGWSNRCDRPAGHDGLCEGPARMRAAQTRPTVPIEFEDDNEPRGEPARQPCDEGAPGSTPRALTSTQALDEGTAAVSSALPDSRVQEQPPAGPSPTEPQEPDGD